MADDANSIESLRKAMQYALIKVHAQLGEPTRVRLDPRAPAPAELRYAGGDAIGLRGLSDDRCRAVPGQLRGVRECGRGRRLGWGPSARGVRR